MSGASDPELDEQSRRIIGAVDELKALEQAKRRTARSSDEFHQLAEAVEDKADEVWRFAENELRMGDKDSSRPVDHEATGPGDWTRPDDFGARDARDGSEHVQRE